MLPEDFLLCFEKPGWHVPATHRFIHFLKLEREGIPLPCLQVQTIELAVTVYSNMCRANCFIKPSYSPAIYLIGSNQKVPCSKYPCLPETATQKQSRRISEKS